MSIDYICRSLSIIDEYRTTLHTLAAQFLKHSLVLIEGLKTHLLSYVVSETRFTKFFSKSKSFYT